MNSIRNLTFCVISAIYPAFHHSPCVAQEITRTVEGAQRFLAVMAEQKRFSLVMDRGLGLNTTMGTVKYFKNSKKDILKNYNDKWPAMLDRFYNVSISYESGSYCQTLISAHGPFYQKGKLFNLTSEVPTSYLYEVYNYIDPESIYGKPVAINWSSVTFSRGNDFVYLETEQRSKIWIYPRDAETLNRIEYAVRFMKLSCDESSATGF